MHDDSTIFATATAPGKGGVAVFRLSGAKAKNALRLCAPSSMPQPRKAALREIKNPESGDILDRALVLFFPAPESYTGEDVIEFHTHGGRAVTQAIVEALQALPNFRLAEPGEFTRRAFENGRMDLTEAEAVADLVNAETEAQRKQALRQMEGALGKLYADWHERLSRALAYIEGAIDFSEEELPEDLLASQNDDLRQLQKEIAAHLNDNHRGERLREGFSIVLLGPPNAGKSSLLNALARREAAIVSPEAGTTRDLIDVHLDIGGYPVILTDTAGLRERTDRSNQSAIETEGIRRAKARAENADLKIIVFDGAAWPQTDETAMAQIDGDSLIVINKADLFGGIQDSGFGIQERKNLPPPCGEGRGGGSAAESIQDLGFGIQERKNPPPPCGEGRGGGSAAETSIQDSGFSIQRKGERHPREGGDPSFSQHSERIIPPYQVRGRLLRQGLEERSSVGNSLQSESDYKETINKALSIPRIPNPESRIPLPVSALTGQGIDALLDTLHKEIDARFTASASPPLTRARHRAALEECAENLNRSLQAPQTDMRAEDVRLAMRALGRITGRVDVEDLLDIIFKDFCIGK